MNTVRPAAVAGYFYPAEPPLLRRQLAAYLEAAPAAVPRLAPKLLCVPHAGYDYSGAVAARAYVLLLAQPRRPGRVVLLGPSHRVAFRGLAAPQAQAFDTPLGRVPVDQASVAGLHDLPQLTRDDGPHAHEHALEVQLPFLQTVLGEFSVVPLVVGDATPDEVAQVIERLWGGDETLVVVSSDLSHYLPYAMARTRDRATLDRILAFDATLDPHDACGAQVLNGALPVAQAHGLVPRLLDWSNSGDTAGDRQRVVGYGALAFAAKAS